MGEKQGQHRVCQLSLKPALSLSFSTMRISATLLCLLLIAAAFSIQVWAQPDGPNASTCCYVKKQKIPKRNLKSYRRITSSRCPWEAVIFKTKKGMEVCAEAHQKWVEEAIAYLDMKTPTPKP